MVTELPATTEQFQDSKPCQPRLAAAQALLCTQGSCIFNFTMKGFFSLLTLSLHIAERGLDQWLLMGNLNRNKGENFLAWRGSFNVCCFPSQGVFLLSACLFP